MRSIWAIALVILLVSCSKSTTEKIDDNKITIQVVNRGIIGNTSNDLSKRIDYELKSPADIVVLMIGTNDITARRPYEEYINNLKYIIDCITNSGAKLILMSPPPRGIDVITSPAYYWNGRNDTLALINDSLSKANNVYYINMNQAFKDAGTPNPTASSLIFNPANNPGKPDGIHLTRAGTAFIAKKVAGFIKATFSQNDYTTIMCIGDSLTAGENIGYPRTLSLLLND
ncbi:GDSL-type esterase/lipase family protein [Mucilaginibacter sp. UR6-1]|uniref:SGNH/GDSL hydrolase family protein n=1 Tax=Mucilaginibacter sp. UR6-1 TaxID=1435643 RepID=UPI001E42D15D|nr:GDSL-type esterase/lipase family protein [Mucilaginibacter sp. UR6-1]MCC8408827.1 GDSL-type esterase/lipase family protein [Mucilaginibacter sp. UR6-1]